MYNLSLTTGELVKVMTALSVVADEASPDTAEPYRDVLKVIESQTSPKAMGGDSDE